MDNEAREILQEILTKVSTLDSKVSSLDNKVSTLESGQQELRKEVSTLDHKISTFDHKISTLDHKISTFDEKISTIDQKIDSSENRMISKINENRTEIMTYLESKIQKDIKQIADGHLMLADKMDRMQGDIDEIKSTVTAHEIIITKKHKMA